MIHVSLVHATLDLINGRGDPQGGGRSGGSWRRVRSRRRGGQHCRPAPGAQHGARPEARTAHPLVRHAAYSPPHSD